METNTEEDPCKVTAEESKTAVESKTFDVAAQQTPVPANPTSALEEPLADKPIKEESLTADNPALPQSMGEVKMEVESRTETEEGDSKVTTVQTTTAEVTAKQAAATDNQTQTLPARLDDNPISKVQQKSLKADNPAHPKSLGEGKMEVEPPTTNETNTVSYALASDDSMPQQEFESKDIRLPRSQQVPKPRAEESRQQSTIPVKLAEQQKPKPQKSGPNGLLPEDPESHDMQSKPEQKSMIPEGELNRQHQYRYIDRPISLNEMEEELKEKKKDLKKEFPNVAFYCDKETATYQKIFLCDIHGKLSQDWRWMESCHDYIQWLFPNHYKSRFNWHSHELTFEEAEVFRRSEQIGMRMLQSFKQYLLFMGIKVDIEEATWNVVSGERLYDVLVENTHNHLRIRRILACLSVTGFRLLALWLINIIEDVIENQPALKKKGRWGYTSISLPRTFKEDWQIYGDGQSLKDAVENCFVKNIDVFYQVNPALRNIEQLQDRFINKTPKKLKRPSSG